MSSQKNDRKRPWNTHVKQKCVETGISGLLFTCEGHEKQALQEAYNIIEELLEKVLPGGSKEVQVADESEDEEDISDVLKKACKKDRDANKQRSRPVKQRPTGAKNILFIKLPNEVDVTTFAERLVDDSQMASKTRFLQRVLPIETTCVVEHKAVADNLAKLVSGHLAKREDESYPSYALDFRARHNDSMSKSSILEMLDQAVTALAAPAKVNLSTPDVMLQVQIVGKTAMLGSCRNYSQRRKFSLRPKPVEQTPAKPTEEKEPEPPKEDKKE